MKKSTRNKARKAGKRAGGVKRTTKAIAGPPSSRNRTVQQSPKTGRITRSEARAAIRQYLKDSAA